MNKIVIKSLAKVFPASYGSVTALSHLDLAIAEHEFVVLLGPSGCGKTTLVRIMADWNATRPARSLSSGAPRESR